MTNENKDKLKDLFQEIKPTDPSPGLEYRIMQQISKIAVEQKQVETKRNNVLSIIGIVASIVALFALPALVLYIMGWTPDTSLRGLKTSFVASFSSFDMNASILIIAAIGLTLLIVDLLVRKHLNEKHSHKNTH